jgi:hydrogenase expression/formation protein HypE
VRPLFFPGGDIGRLAVCGTVNDLAMVGARPVALSCAFIIEEGLPLASLRRVLASMKKAAREAGVRIVTGDTKVVERGSADGLFVNTAGLGTVPEGRSPSGGGARPGDIVLLSGPVGNHGISVLLARERMGFVGSVTSDVNPLNDLVEAMFGVSPNIRVLRDPTRGGVATTLVEVALQSSVGLRVHEERIPVDRDVAAACEVLGYDPLYVANEGKLLAVVGRADAEPILRAMRSFEVGRGAVAVGEVVEGPPGRVIMVTRVGGTRIVDMLAGGQLPRIC